MPDKDDAELEAGQEDEEAEATEEEKAPRKRPRKSTPKKRPQEEAADEEDEDVLPEPVIPPSRGGSSAFVVIIVLFIVVLLVAGVWWQRERAIEDARARRERDRSIAASQLGTIQDRVNKALRDLDQADPDVERAIETLNDACENVGVLAQSISQIDGGPDMSLTLTDIQSAMRRTAQELEEDQRQYEAAVEAAREDLKLSTTGRVRPIAKKIAGLVSSYAGDAETPVMMRVPDTGDAEEEEQATETEPPADTAAEADETGSAAETTEG